VAVIVARCFPSAFAVRAALHLLFTGIAVVCQPPIYQSLNCLTVEWGVGALRIEKIGLCPRSNPATETHVTIFECIQDAIAQIASSPVI